LLAKLILVDKAGSLAASHLYDMSQILLPGGREQAGAKPCQASGDGM